MKAETAIHRFRSVLVAAGLVIASSAHGILPESGWYWNPSESGRGFNIEIQDNSIFMSAFVYRPDGTQVWYVGGGPMTSDRSWSADLLETSQGQCLGCPYRAPVINTVGRASISFSSEKTATITLLGTSVSVVRQDWSGYGTNSRDALYGEWATSDGDPSFPVYGGERVTLNAPFTSSSGTLYASGFRTGSTPNLALGSWDQGLQKFGILIDSSTTFYRFYVFTMNTFNRIEGVYWVYRKGETISGSGTYFVGHRVKSGAFVRTGSGPGISKSLAASQERDVIDAAQYARLKTHESFAVAPDGGIAQMALEMAAVLDRSTAGR